MENYCIRGRWKVIAFRKLNEKIWKYSNPKYTSIQVYSLKFCVRCWWWLLDRSEAVLVPNLDLWQTYANMSTEEAIFQTGNCLKYSWTHKNIEDLWFIFWLQFDYILTISDNILTIFWLQSGYILATFWLYSGYILNTFWLHSDHIRTTFWLNSDYILTTFWLHLDYILATFWLNFVYIPATFWLH